MVFKIKSKLFNLQHRAIVTCYFLSTHLAQFSTPKMPCPFIVSLKKETVKRSSGLPFSLPLHLPIPLPRVVFLLSPASDTFLSSIFLNPKEVPPQGKGILPSVLPCKANLSLMNATVVFCSHRSTF